MTLCQILSEFVAERRDFSEEAIYLAKKSILDSMGAIAAGSRTHLVERALTISQGCGPSTIVGIGTGYSLRDAAFVNGIAGHELELDDTSSSNLGHPTIAVLPSLLAVGEAEQVNGLTLIKAFLLAAEIECKIGRICARKLHESGWHASSVTGVIGAAAGSAYLMQLDKERVCNAIGIAASMASGIRENFGTATKSVHIGKTAQDGVHAAQLARAGFDASKNALDGKEGYLFEYGRAEFGPFDEAFASTLGNDWDVCSPGFAIKRYPSCSSTHRAIDALVDLIDTHHVKASDIDEISVGLSASALRELVTPYPKNGEEAKFSIGFQIALYLEGLDNMPEQYTEDVINREPIQNIIQRTRMYHVEKYDQLPVDMGVGPAFSAVRLKTGQTFSKEQIYPVGHLTNPISDQELKEKFLRCCMPVYGKKQSEKLYDRLFCLQDVQNVAELMKEFVPD